MAKVSILMPIYNAEKYLYECLKSIEQQTYSDFEVLMVDDGSKDNSGAICNYFETKDSRFKVRHQMNQGAGMARNTAIAWAMKTDSEYIAWIDADDVLALDYLELLVSQLEANPEYDMVQCDYCSKKNELKQGINLNEEVIVKGSQLIREMLGEHYGVAFTLLWNKLYKKTLYEGVFVYTDEKITGRMQDDVNILWQIYLKSKGCLWVRCAKYYYRIVDNSIQHQKIANKNLEFLWIYLKMYEKLTQIGKTELADFVGERMLFELAKKMGYPKDMYDNYSIFCRDAFKIYNELRKKIKFKCKRWDLKILALFSRYNKNFLQLYGIIYVRVKGLA